MQGPVWEVDFEPRWENLWGRLHGNVKSGIDNGVVLKFMRNTEQFRWEVDFCDDRKFDSKYVVGVTDCCSCDTDDKFATPLKSHTDNRYLDLGDYKHAIVMLQADWNLDTIFRSERSDKNQIRVLVKQLTNAITHVHSKGIIHSDVKRQNVVRCGEGLRLIDLDASIEIDSFAHDAKYDSFAGAKFSSGVLPPEMIAKLTMEEYKRFQVYFETVNADEWAKICPKKSGDIVFFAVNKTFRPTDLEHSREIDESRTFVTKKCIKHADPVDKWNLP